MIYTLLGHKNKLEEEESFLLARAHKEDLNKKDILGSVNRKSVLGKTHRKKTLFL